jgi:acetyltransferase-like isoleucine patch superfamily enzyme
MEMLEQVVQATPRMGMEVQVSEPKHATFEDPLTLIPRVHRWFHSRWLTWTYPFASVGRNLSVHNTVDLRRSTAGHIKIGNFVAAERGAWINIPDVPGRQANKPVMILDDNVKIGRNSQISAKNFIHFERNVMVSGNVLVMDHSHAYEDVTMTIGNQGTTEGGSVRIEEGCWIGYGAVILCSRGELVIGRNSVIGANCFVSRSIPPFSIVANSPARVVKQYDPSTQTWKMGALNSAKQSEGS